MNYIQIRQRRQIFSAGKRNTVSRICAEIAGTGRRIIRTDIRKNNENVFRRDGISSRRIIYLTALYPKGAKIVRTNVGKELQYR